MRFLLLSLLILGVLAGLVVFGAGPLMNSEMVRGRVVAALEQATGHAVRVGGALQVAPGSLVALAPVIGVDDVAVLNGPGFSRAAMVSARRVEAVVALWPLLEGRVEVRSVRVEGPDLLLERDAQGRGNWERAEPAPVVGGSETAPRAALGARMAVEVGPVGIEGGRVAGLGIPVLAVRSATVTSSGGPVKVLAQGSVGALPVGVALEVRRSPEHGDAVVLEVTADGGTFETQGVVDLGRGAYEGTVSATVPDVGRLASLAGVAAPVVRDARFSARIMPGPSGFMLRGMQLSSAQGDLAGDLAVVVQPRVSVRGSLVGQQWNLDEWRLGVPASVPVAAPAVSAGPLPAATAEQVLPFGVLRRMDGDLQVAVGQLVYQGGTYREVRGRAVLQDGRLRLDPMEMNSPAGAVQGRLSVDAGAVPPRAAMVVHAPGLEGAGLAAVAGVAGAATGKVDLDADLRSAGASWVAMGAGLSGSLAASLVDGDVENAMLARLFGPVLRSANIPMEMGGRSRVRCMTLRMEAVEGQVRVGTLALDTTRLRLEGEGTVDLGGETMDLHLRPMIRIGGAGVSVPVRVSGPFRAPRVVADKGVLAPGRFGISIAQLGAMLGGGAGADPCGAGR